MEDFTGKAQDLKQICTMDKILSSGSTFHKPFFFLTLCIFSHSKIVTCKPDLLPLVFWGMFKFQARWAVYLKDIIRVNVKFFF